MAKFNFTQYMHNIAIGLKDIGHVDNDNTKNRFFRIASISELDELLQQLPSFKGFGLLVEDNQEGNYLMNGGNMILDGQLCSFFIIRKAELENAADRGDQIRQAETIMRKIVTRIRRDYHNDHALKSDIGLRNMQWDTFRYFTFGPVVDNCYGVYCNFVVQTHMDLKYTEADWNE